MKRNFASWTISILSFVMIFSFTGCSQNQQLDDAAAQMTNSTLGQYAGTKVRGSTVKQLFEKARISNVNKTLPTEITVKLSNTEVTDTLSSASVVDTKYYKVTVTDSNSDGYYDLIEVE